jgi:hypothetical protein
MTATNSFVNHEARRLLQTGFDSDDVIAIAFRRLPDGGWHHRFLSVHSACQPRFQAWLRHLNANGNDLYVSVNAFRAGVRSRTEANVAAVRHLYVEFDAGGETALAAVRARPDLPPPSYVVHSSPGKFQLLWNVEGFTPFSAKPLLRHLAYSLQADIAVHDVNRVLRLPGFANYKYRPPARVWLEMSNCLQRYSPDRFPVPAEPSHSLSSRHRRLARPRGTHSQSELDWRLVCLALARGASWRTCVEHLAKNRADKCNPRAYATLTVLKALQAIRHVAPPELLVALAGTRTFESGSR